MKQEEQEEQEGTEEEDNEETIFDRRIDKVEIKHEICCLFEEAKSESQQREGGWF
jgi:hypothetical protein